MKTRKSIAYCYPTSPRAKQLGAYKTGCWFIQIYHITEAGRWSIPYVAPGTEGDTFQVPNHPDLISLYHEFTEAEPCPMFLRHGSPLALAAIAELTRA